MVMRYYINKYVKDETYRKNKTKEPSLIKILNGLMEFLTINIIMNIDKKEFEIVQKQLSWF